MSPYSVNIFQNKNLNSFIRNDENNENWPDSNSFEEITKKWWENIDWQQKQINKFEIYNNKTRQLIADVRT